MEQSTPGRHWALILAGGDGTRLQELTREITGAPIPKQYCRIVGTRSLLESTLARTRHYAPAARTLVVINENHLAVARDQLDGVPRENVLVQPCNRDTGPGLTLALLDLARRDPEAIVGVFPSDHYVSDDRAFIGHVAHATRVVTHLPIKITLLGIHPDRPEPEYGYVVPRSPLRMLAAAGCAFHVARFQEKPDSEGAQRLLNQGALWNSFVMVFHLRRMLELLHEILPVEFARMQTISRSPSHLTAAYQGLTRWNFSSGFLARIPEHLVVLRVENVYWSDWGTRESIERTLRTLNQAPPWQARPRTAACAA